MEPVCPSCRIGWSREFLDEHLTGTYRNGLFKQFRQKVLTDRERARFPEIQEQAANYKKAIDFLRPIDAEITKLKLLKREKRINLDLTFNAYMASFTINPITHTRIESERTPELKIAYENARAEHYNEDYMKACKRIDELNKLAYKQRRIEKRFGVALPPRPLRRRARAAAAAGGAGGPARPEVAPVKEFVYTHKCPADACEGFLNAQWTCGLCELKVCKSCLEPTAADHTCNPDTVESVKAIKKEAKPCPKCKAQISKIDGCDQMWCTQCHTAFSWNTGMIDTTRTHNPHYYEYMNQLREAGELPENPQGANLFPDYMRINPCGADAVMYRLTQLRRGANVDIVNMLMRYHRLLAHIQGVNVVDCQRIVQNYLNAPNHDDWRFNLRIRRMANEITEGEWKSILHSKEKEMMKERSRCQVLEMYATAGMDIIGQVITNDNVQDILKHVTTLYEFAEKASQKVSAVYKCPPMDLYPPEMDQEIMVISRGRGFQLRRHHNPLPLHLLPAPQPAAQPAPVAT